MPNTVAFMVVLTAAAAKRLGSDRDFKDFIFRNDRLLCTNIDWGKLLGLTVQSIGTPHKGRIPEARVHIDYDAVLYILEGAPQNTFGIVPPASRTRPGRRRR